MSRTRYCQKCGHVEDTHFQFTGRCLRSRCWDIEHCMAFATGSIFGGSHRARADEKKKAASQKEPRVRLPVG
jgi:hypothetical protein|tara:strand:+ start:292 stop:507 length:216 start_codon:yes stop_codon:yes gene_type:complete